MGENQNLKNLHHIIILPPPFQGHINPSIQLTLQLASKGFIVTFINTEATHNQITKTKSREGNDDVFAGSGLDIRYRTINDGFPLSFDRSFHREQFMMGRIHVYSARIIDAFAAGLLVRLRRFAVADF
ncbi:UDP-glycosyltransferase 86a1 [Phtheirospermum japonicum]|uniref:UDP-glycosyltransferase 86a1 n=1 Tax=Phtheirospermum japonicum TaxID=374723 RepID=A0A830BIQ6_9LAMI|nr:UDP-glycosyltransferase 86a1 [Phtheirospermum japonicum]